LKLEIAFAALLLSSSAAFAADAIQSLPEAPVASTYTWTGAYAGVHAGYGWGHTRDTNNPAAEKKDIDGGLGGIQAGYNYQFDNNIVLGVEGDISFGSINNKWRDPNQYSGYWTEDKVTALGTLRARLGYAVDNFLPYVTGGLAIGRTKHSLGCDPALVSAGIGSCASDPSRVFSTSESKTSTGYAVGFGGEYAFSSNWTLKAEYLYTDLGKNSVTLIDPHFPSSINERKFETKFSTVRLGVNYRF
jgi:outer membrane immunogenic protein